MERDFLGVIGKESGSLAKDDGRSNRLDSVGYTNGSGMQWPFSNKPAPSPPFMSIKTLRDDKSDQFSISGFPKSENPIPIPLLSQQYAVRGFQTRNPDSFAHNVNGSRGFPSGPFMQNSPFMKVNNGPNPQNITVTPLKQNSYNGAVNLNNHLVGSTAGLLPPRDVQKPAPSAQLTIFYAGSVCSFDNIPVDKVKEILIMASKASSMAPPPVPQMPSIETSKPMETEPSKNLNAIQTQIQINTTIPKVSSPVSIISLNNNNNNKNNNGSMSRSGSSSNNTEPSNLPKPLSPLGQVGPTCQTDPSSSNRSGVGSQSLAGGPSLPSGLGATTANAIMPRAVPQARKASLARFLEKRKERVSSVVPYPCTKNPSENCENSENSNLSSKSKSNIFELRNCDDSFSFSQSTNSSYIDEAPNTKLQI